LNGDVIELKFLDDLAWGRIGRLKTVLDSIETNPTSDFITHKLVFDTRSPKSKLLDKHPSRAIPLDHRVYQPPDTPPPSRLLQAPTNKVFLARTSFLTSIIRFQGRPQPVWLSMVLHNIRAKNQRNLMLYQTLIEYLEMAQFEHNLVYHATGTNEAYGFDTELIIAINNLQLDFEHRRQAHEARVNAFACRNNLYIPPTASFSIGQVDLSEK